MTMKLYIDTRGRSKGLWRDAPEGARIAAHTDHGVVELEVNPDGSWYVHHGPKVNQAGSYETVAQGRRTTTEPTALDRAVRAVRYIRKHDCDFLTVENVLIHAQLPEGCADVAREAIRVEIAREPIAGTE